MKNSKKSELKDTVASELKNKIVLITGGAGSIGSAITHRILKYPVKSVRVLDIDEHALFKLKRTVNDKRVRYLLGSILDRERIDMAGNRANIVIHAAAIKNIEISEFNPIQTIETNINGTVNMIKMCMINKPKKFLNISTDKATNPTTLYGTTKNIGEKLTSWAGSHVYATKYASARFGNVIETRGNVFEVWDEERKNGKPLSITHPAMKRYFFSVDEAVDFILECLPQIKNGEIFVPKMKSFKVKDLANKISNRQKIIGLRKGEKLDEILISEEEKKRAVERKNMWIIKQS